MGSLVKATLQTGVASLALLVGLVVASPEALANANPTPDKKVENCVPSGGVVINGGSVTNKTNLDLSADGGTSIGDATGGDDNVALTLDGDDSDDDVASAGNGGSADAAANGGAIGTGDVNSGENTGNTISVGDTFSGGCAPLDKNGNAIVSAAVQIDGGTVTNETNINVSADGGTAIADASGGDNNIAVNNGRNGSAGNGGVASAGNGGTANSSANGGAISIGDINSGSNSGNTISVGNTISGGVPVPGKPVPGKPVPGKPVPPKKGGKPTPAPKRELPKALPDTGTGDLVQGEANLQLLAVLAAATLAGAVAGQQAMSRRRS